MGKGDKTALMTKDVSLACTEVDARESDLFMVGDYPEQDWWTLLDDENLTCLIERAIAKNPGLLAMEKRVESANQQALMVRSKLFPEISGLFQYAWLYLVDEHFLQALLPTASNNAFLYDLMFNFSYEFDFWGKNKKKYKAALGSAKATRFLYEQSKVILSSSLATSYFNLVAMKAKREVLLQLLSQKERYLSLIQLRKKNRLASKMDEHTYITKVKGIEDALAAVDAEVLLEESLISILAASNPEEKIETKMVHEVFAKKLEMPEKITSTLLARRPDLLSALWATKKNALNVGVSITNFLPDVTLMDAPGLIANKGADLFSGNSFANILFPEIKQPLFTGGRLLAAWRASVAEYESSIYDFNNIFLKAAKEVYDAVLTFIEAEERREIQENKLLLAKENYELESLKFANGISSYLPVIEYDEIYLQNKVMMIEKERSKRLAYISFIKALGGGFKCTGEDCEE